jgi:hypothetical protein
MWLVVDMLLFYLRSTSLNQLIKHYYFNNTSHGGSAGNGGQNSVGQYVNGTISGDHCRPLMRLCQRSMMWKLGLGDAYFQQTIMNKLNEKIAMKSSATMKQMTTIWR